MRARKRDRDVDEQVDFFLLSSFNAGTTTGFPFTSRKGVDADM